MTERLMRRAGLSSEAFDIYTIHDGGLEKFWTDPTVKVVIGCGESVLRYVIGETDIRRWQNRPIEHISGKIFLPSFLPSKLVHHKEHSEPGVKKKRGILNPPRFQICYIYGLHKALRIVKHGFIRQQGTYVLDPSPGEFKRFVHELLFSGREFTFDIETAYKQKAMKEDELDEGDLGLDSNKLITRISFSDRSYFGLTVPFTGPYLADIRHLLESANDKNGWNSCNFDVEILAANGYKVNGAMYDYMDAWHMYMSDLDKDLEFTSGMTTDALPWKHLNLNQPALYNAMDSDVQMRCAVEIRKLLESAGQWNLFKRHGVYLSPILKEAGKRGNCIDIAAQNQLGEELEQEYEKLTGKAQGEVTFELYPRDKIVKTKLPEGGVLADEGAPSAARLFELVPREGKQKRCGTCLEVFTNKSTHQKGKGNPCKGAEIITENATLAGYQEILAFNPNSSDQMKEYMRRHGHPLGKSKDGEDKETADAKHLKKLVKIYPKHPIYQTALELHKVTKALGTYVEGLRPDSKGRVYTTYVNSPSTWRLGSRAVNMQNQGKRESNPWAKRARSTIIASPDNVLVQADSSSIEAVLVGYFMGDQDYIKLAKQSIHAYVVCKVLGWEFTKANIDLVKEEHKALYDQMKITNHLSNYGGTPHMMCELFPELFPTVGKARELQGKLFEVLPQLPRWHHELRHTAQKEGYLETPWGYRHYFWDVFSLNANGTKRYGKDSKRCIAFKPQNSAGAIARDNILIMGTTNDQYQADPECYPKVPTWSELYGGHWRPYMPANLTVHDGYCLDVPLHYRDAAAQYLAKLLTRPIYELGGLRIGCEVECGTAWGKMEKLFAITTLEDEAELLFELAA